MQPSDILALNKSVAGEVVVFVGASRTLEACWSSSVVMAGLFVVVLSFQPAYSKEKWTKIDNEQALISFLVSDLEERYRSTWKLPDPSHNFDVKQSAQWRDSTRFFKAILIHYDLAGGMIYEYKWDLKKIVTFKQFKGASLTFGSVKATKNGLGRVEYRLFEFQDRGCVVLRSYWGSSPTITTYEGTAALIGYYCTSVGKQLTDAAAIQIIKAIGIKSVAEPEGRYTVPGGSAKSQGAKPDNLTSSSTTTGTTPTTTSSVPLAINWDGWSDLLLGRLTFSNQRGTGKIIASVPGTECEGNWKYVSGKYNTADLPEGIWSVTCSNGKAASGTYVSDAPKQGTGSGKDLSGNQIRVTYGER